jgi:hypothetical protein
VMQRKQTAWQASANGTVRIKLGCPLLLWISVAQSN